MLEMAFYWSLFFTQFFDVKRKVGNTIDVGLDEHPGLLGDVHPPRGHPGPPHPQLEQSHAPDGLLGPHRPRLRGPLARDGKALALRRMGKVLRRLLRDLHTCLGILQAWSFPQLGLLLHHHRSWTGLKKRNSYLMWLVESHIYVDNISRCSLSWVL